MNTREKVIKIVCCDFGIYLIELIIYSSAAHKWAFLMFFLSLQSFLIDLQSTDWEVESLFISFANL